MTTASEMTQKNNLLILAAIVISTLVAINRVEADPKFAALIPLSGGFAPTGEDNKRGFELALDQFPESAKDTFIFEDTQADVKTSLSIYEKLVKLYSLLGVYVIRSPLGLALNNLSNRDKMPLLGGVAHTKFTEANPFAVGVWSTTSAEGDLIAKTLLDRKIADRVCMITTTDDFLLAITDSVRAGLTSNNHPPALNEEIDPNEMDLRGILLKVKQKNCSALFLNLVLAQYAPALKRTYEAQLTMPKFGNYWLQKPEVLSAAGNKAGEGFTFVEMKVDQPEFLAAYHKKFGDHRPTSASLSGFAAGILMLEVLSKHPKIDSPKEFYQELLKVSEINSLGYHVPIKDRRVEFPLVLKRVESGKVVADSK